ncbi:MAG: sulfatase [Verrucomicrobiae bacterium]|nr:sulfatase [Verrucomicrobiae bacterium]
MKSITPLLIAISLLTGSAFGEVTKPQNVLFIAVDDLSSALGCYGDPVAITPHIDALAARGVRFEHAYNQLPLCNPSRASILTGLRPDQIRVYDLDRHFRDERPDTVSLPQLFKNNGWFSARVGKLYHYNVPAGIGTDGLDDPPSWHQVVNPKGRDVADEALIFNAEPHRKISAALSWLAAEGADEEQTDGMITTQAIRLMTEKKGAPFFLGVGYFRPHTPYVAPKKYFDLYPLEKMTMPDAPENDRDDIPTPAFAHNNPVPNYGLPIETCLKAKQAYYACVSFVDAQVGRLMASLDELGLADNTIIVFWSDHGYHLGEHRGIWQKRTVFEECAATPFIISAPGASGNGRACPRIVEFVDLYPTLAELCGIELPGSMPLTGKSLKPLLENPEAPWAGNAVTQVLRPADDRLPTQVMGRSIRTERWRYTEWNEGAAGLELYDHENDPGEFTNLAIEPSDEAKAVIEQLKPLLQSKAEGMPPTTPVNPERL